MIAQICEFGKMESWIDHKSLRLQLKMKNILTLKSGGFLVFCQILVTTEILENIFNVIDSIDSVEVIGNKSKMHSTLMFRSQLHFETILLYIVLVDKNTII